MACGDCVADNDGEDMVDAPLRQGEKRGCTDCLCCIVFLAFWIGMVMIAGYSLAYGNVLRLVYGYDSYGNVCSQMNEKIENVTLSGMDMTDRPHVFFMDITQASASLEICVSKCPDKKLLLLEDIAAYSEENDVKLCRYDIEVDDYTNQEQDLMGPCPELVLDSKPILNRCIPNDVKELAEAQINDIVDFLNASEFISKALMDLYVARWWILGLCIISMVVAFIIMVLLHIIAQVIVWVIYVLSSVGSIAGTIALWVTYYYKKRAYDDTPPHQQLEMEADNVRTFLIFSICATVFTVILLLVILVMRKRISFAIELFHQAGKAISAMPLLLLQPFWTFIVLFVFFVYVAAVFVAIAATGEATLVEETGFVTYDPPKMVRYFWWYHLIGFIWTMEFLLACHQFVIAASVVTWYFTRNKKSFGSPILNSIWVLSRYHLGSMVFGAFIITLVKVPRAILLYIQAKLKGRESSVAQFILRCLSCCLWCLEKILKFINAHAYIVIAIEGKSFCPAARRALNCLISNALRVAAINCVGDFILFLGKLLVVCITALIGVAVLGYNEELHYYAIPVFLACIFAFMVASSYFSVYEMAVDTLLLCFCEDIRTNDGTADKPYFMETGLLEFVNDSTKKLNSMSKRRRTEAAGDEADAGGVVKPAETEALHSQPPAEVAEENEKAEEEEKKE
ncbi:Choline transporter-like protein 1 [Holothuria leucospilota]|uniref:Choline transporter-like protein n=1 Tax=Holothuria leucospilota TaxID=206669 RepID=A0A9Q1C908_HOLLE|nr:Choline transporter-like protein 1 [Holothuria leucospilota]